MIRWGWRLDIGGTSFLPRKGLGAGRSGLLLWKGAVQRYSRLALDNLANKSTEGSRAVREVNRSKIQEQALSPYWDLSYPGVHGSDRN